MSKPSYIFADTHCHLTLNAFDHDRSRVVDRALQAGVQKIVVPGIDLPSSRAAVDLSEKYPSIYAAVGVHPHHANQWKSYYREEIVALAKSKKVVALGEIGLDYYRNHSSPQLQLEVFKTQLEIASQMKLPVIVHNRDATSDIIEYLCMWLKGLNPPSGKKMGVLHAFSADMTTALRMIEAGFLVGIAGPITYKSAAGLREVAAQIPLSSILIETDAPYLTPHPYRGKRNEPARVVLVAEYLSKIIGVDEKTTTRVTFDNAAGLFGWQNGTNHSILH